MHWPILLRRVIGHSMLPTLSPGKLVIVRPGAPLRIGDIVVATYKGKEVIKRVVAIDARRVQLIGDNHAHGHSVGWIEKGSIVGRVYYLHM